MRKDILLGLTALWCILGNCTAKKISCLESEEDIINSGWIDFYDSHGYAKDGTELPGEFASKLNGEGILFFQGSPDRISSSLIRLKETGTEKEYIYLRYYYHNSSGSDNYQVRVFPVDNGGFLDTTPDYEWKEAFFQINAVNFYNRDVFSTSKDPRDFLLIDTIIHVIGADYNSVEEMRNLCANPEPPTEPPGPQPGIVTEWIDDLEDFEASQWESSDSLSYALDESQLPSAISNMSADGIFYLRGNPRQKQQTLFRNDHVGTGGEAFIFLRYYMHKSSASPRNQAYISPVVGQVQGIQYLDSRRDYAWKEVFVKLDTTEASATEIGIRSNSVKDILLIDELVFLYRAPGSKRFRVDKFMKQFRHTV